MVTKIGFSITAVALVGVTYALAQQDRQLEELTALVGKPVSRVPSSSSASAPDPLAVRVQRLEAEIEDLRQAARVAQPLDTSQIPGPRPEPDSTGASATRVASSVDGTETAVMEVLESDNPKIRQRVKALLREEQERLSGERRELRDARLAERSRERVSELAARVGLSDAQLALLEGAIDAERVQVSELFGQARADLNFTDARAKAKKIREATDERVRSELTSAQFAAYEQMRAQDRARFGPLSRPPSER